MVPNTRLQRTLARAGLDRNHWFRTSVGDMTYSRLLAEGTENLLTDFAEFTGIVSCTCDGQDCECPVDEFFELPLEQMRAKLPKTQTELDQLLPPGRRVAAAA
jgi:hypothetical protein